MKFDITFDEFKTEYIDNLDGYLPTYISADEEHKSSLMRINVEMIAPCRMTDGPARFFRVITIDVTKEQYDQIRQYAINAGNRWQSDLMSNVENCLKYSQTQF